jgi:hypothetical protein
MSVRISRLRRGIGVVALAAAACAALLGAGAGPASAASGQTVRFGPLSNPFLTVEVKGASYDNGAQVDQWSINGGLNQAWTLQPSGGYVEFVNRQTGKCLTSDGIAGDTLYQYSCLGAGSQLWSTGLTAGNLVSYSIRNVGSGLYMDVRGAAGWQGADIITWYWNGGNNQYFNAQGA